MQKEKKNFLCTVSCSAFVMNKGFVKEGGGEKSIYSYNAFNNLLSYTTVGYKRSCKIYVSAAV